MSAPVAGVRAEERALDNGLLRVEVAADGTLALTGADGSTLTGAGRIVDGGDVGDTYNYAPPAEDRIVSDPVSAELTLVCSGPLVAAFDVRRTYRWPAAGQGIEGTPEIPAAARTEATEEIVVDTRVELRAGEPYVRLHVSFDNRCSDHRVRLHVPLPARAAASHAEGQFAVVTRGLSAEGGCGEEPLPAFPASGWVAAGGVAALLEHVTEYELVDDGAELALTLLRSVGYLSRNLHAMRPEPAGPQLPTRPPSRAACARSASRSCRTAGRGRRCQRRPRRSGTTSSRCPAPASSLALPPAASGLSVTGDGVVMTSLRVRDGRHELRVVAYSETPTNAVISGTFAQARHADLRGRPGNPIPVSSGTVHLPLRPWEIATIQLGN